MFNMFQLPRRLSLFRVRYVYAHTCDNGTNHIFRRLLLMLVFGFVVYTLPTPAKLPWTAVSRQFQLCAAESHGHRWQSAGLRIEEQARGGDVWKVRTGAGGAYSICESYGSYVLQATGRNAATTVDGKQVYRMVYTSKQMFCYSLSCVSNVSLPELDAPMSDLA